MCVFFFGCSNKVSTSNVYDTSHPPTIMQGEKILHIGKQMALIDKEVPQGECWDYIDALFTRAGYPQTKRFYVFKKKAHQSSYAPLDSILPGNWIYYINHSYNKVTHSDIFVRWHNRSQNQAIILSYGGESKKEPAHCRIYDITHTFIIIRAN